MAAWERAWDEAVAATAFAVARSLAPQGAEIKRVWLWLPRLRFGRFTLSMRRRVV
jgi:hypothetical protein